MATQERASKKLSPNGVKSKLILEAIGISQEILLGLMVQELIPRELPRGGLDEHYIALEVGMMEKNRRIQNLLIGEPMPKRF